MSMKLLITLNMLSLKRLDEQHYNITYLFLDLLESSRYKLKSRLNQMQYTTYKVKKSHLTKGNQSRENFKHAPKS